MRFFFFFSSRRRHTRFSRDWSSDVCSSDLIPQFYEVWNPSAFRLMENSFDNAHFAFVHKGTFGQLSQPLPEKYEIVETDYGFEAETLITVANPPVQHRISGTTAPTTKRHMRNKW